MPEKIGDRVRILGGEEYHDLATGTEATVTGIMGASITVITDKRQRRALAEGDYELVARKDVLELIANLSAKVVRLEQRVVTLERKAYVEENRPNVKLTKPKTREEIIKQANEDVESLARDTTSDGKLWYVVGKKSCVADFVINSEKRTVVVLMRGTGTGRMYAKGKAKAAPDDCFNVHIGKVIALRRALGLEVPAEYLNAPQPKNIRSGDVVRTHNGFMHKCTHNHGRIPDGAIILDDSDREVNA